MINKLRFFLVIAALFVYVFLAVFLDLARTADFQGTLQRALVSKIADVVIEPADENPSAIKGIPIAISNELKKFKTVKSWVSEVSAEGYVAYKKTTEPVMITALRGSSNQISRKSLSVISGRLPRRLGEAIITKSIFASNNLSIGSNVRLSGQWGGKNAVIVGVVDPESSLIGYRNAVFVTPDFIKQLTPISNNETHRLYLSSNAVKEQFIKSIKKDLPEAVTARPMQPSPVFDFSVIENDPKLNLSIILLLVLAITFLISVVIMEKTYQATITSLGNPFLSAVKGYVSYIFIPGTIGLIGGASAAVSLASLYFSSIGKSKFSTLEKTFIYCFQHFWILIPAGLFLAIFLIIMLIGKANDKTRTILFIFGILCLPFGLGSLYLSKSSNFVAWLIFSSILTSIGIASLNIAILPWLLVVLSKVFKHNQALSVAKTIQKTNFIWWALPTASFSLLISFVIVTSGMSAAQKQIVDTQIKQHIDADAIVTSRQRLFPAAYRSTLSSQKQLANQISKLPGVTDLTTLSIKSVVTAKNYNMPGEAEEEGHAHGGHNQDFYLEAATLIDTTTNSSLLNIVVDKGPKDQKLLNKKLAQGGVIMFALEATALGIQPKDFIKLVDIKGTTREVEVIATSKGMQTGAAEGRNLLIMDKKAGERFTGPAEDIQIFLRYKPHKALTTKKRIASLLKKYPQFQLITVNDVSQRQKDPYNEDLVLIILTGIISTLFLMVLIFTSTFAIDRKTIGVLKKQEHRALLIVSGLSIFCAIVLGILTGFFFIQIQVLGLQAREQLAYNMVRFLFPFRSTILFILFVIITWLSCFLFLSYFTRRKEVNI